MSAPFWIEKSGGYARVALRDPFGVMGPRHNSVGARSRHERGGVGEGIHRETFGVEEIDAHIDAWSALAARALEPNAFLEPGFAVALARHSPVKSRPRFIAVWREGTERRLIGLFPLAPAQFRLGAGLARLWLDKQMALAAPLLDPEFAVAALLAFFDYLKKTQRAAAAAFPRITQGGAVHQAILAAAKASGRAVETFESFERAALLADSDADELARRGASSKTLKELHRRRRRLEEQGAVEFALLCDPKSVRAAVEQFLALEASGWKGASGALLKDSALSAFARSATRLLAREGKCRIARLTLTGRPLAMGVLFESGNRAFFWKIAYDEAFRAQAPGIDLVYELTRALASRGDITLTDSCAIANHPMIDRFWPDRIAICDIAVELDLARPQAFRNACGAETLSRRLRGFVKRVAIRVLKRRRS